MNHAALILASGSPRRRELLSLTGLPYVVDAPEVDESCALPPEEAVQEISRRKGLAGAAAHPGCVVLSADTLVAVDGKALGKPHSEAEAFQMLSLLSGRWHQVYTGVCAVDAQGMVHQRVVGTQVHFCPMTEEEYDAFWQALTTAEEASVHGFEDKNVFEGCMPVEVMARRGHDTLCYGPLKPRGLRDPKTGKEPYAVVQLRRDNAQGSVYNLVGFQTHLRFPEQKRVFSMIPALHDAEFVRYGVMHRNTYLRSPGMLDRYYRLIADDRIAFAGQMTGVEGYIESAASGFLAGIEMARRLEGKPPVDFPRETAIGALGLYISDTTVSDFQPMNVNFGIMPPLGYRIKGGKRVKNAQLAARSLEKIDAMREDVLSDRKGE